MGRIDYEQLAKDLYKIKIKADTMCIDLVRTEEMITKHLLGAVLEYMRDTIPAPINWNVDNDGMEDIKLLIGNKGYYITISTGSNGILDAIEYVESSRITAQDIKEVFEECSIIVTFHAGKYSHTTMHSGLERNIEAVADLVNNGAVIDEIETQIIHLAKEEGIDGYKYIKNALIDTYSKNGLIPERVITSMMAHIMKII